MSVFIWLEGKKASQSPPEIVARGYRFPQIVLSRKKRKLKGEKDDEKKKEQKSSG
jgi:hypothetical protein